MEIVFGLKQGKNLPHTPTPKYYEYYEYYASSCTVSQIGFKYWVPKFSFRSNIADMSLAIFFPWCIGSMVWRSICIIWHVGPSTSKLLPQLLVISWDTVSVNCNGNSKWNTLPCNCTSTSMIRTPAWDRGTSMPSVWISSLDMSLFWKVPVSSEFQQHQSLVTIS